MPRTVSLYEVISCPCGSPACSNWLITNVAMVQGVSFTREQAETVSLLLNFMDTQEASTLQRLLSVLRINNIAEIPNCANCGAIYSDCDCRGDL